MQICESAQCFMHSAGAVHRCHRQRMLRTTNYFEQFAWWNRLTWIDDDICVQYLERGVRGFQGWWVACITRTTTRNRVTRQLQLIIMINNYYSLVESNRSLVAISSIYFSGISMSISWNVPIKSRCISRWVINQLIVAYIDLNKRPLLILFG